MSQHDHPLPDHVEVSTEINRAARADEHREYDSARAELHAENAHHHVEAVIYIDEDDTGVLLTERWTIDAHDEENAEHIDDPEAGVGALLDAAVEDAVQRIKDNEMLPANY